MLLPLLRRQFGGGSEACSQNALDGKAPSAEISGMETDFTAC
jgi:hypothetical protein